jgi:hypothetical protein
VPAERFITPPTPDEPYPTIKSKEPPRPFVAAPVFKDTEPEEPELEVPDAKVREPLTPATPAFAVVKLRSPLDDEAPTPLIN